MTQQERKELKEQIVAYRKEGHLVRECCERFGVTKGYVKYVCLGINYPWVRDTEAMRQAALEQGKHRLPDEQTAINMIADRLPQFEYFGNYTDADGTVDLKCKECGTVITRQMCAVRHKQVRCPECWERQKEQTAREREREQARADEEKEREKIRRITGVGKRTVQMTFKACAVCGGIIFGERKYCSTKCARRVHSARREITRRARVTKQMVDRDISLEGLYQRDEGKCYLCGIICDWNDYTNEGAFIAGGTYPTIEHVIPLSRGGMHAWSNVKLACFACNTKKGAKMA